MCILMKPLELISTEWFSTICWSSLLFGIFMIEKWVEFSLTTFGILKYDSVIKTREMFNFLPLINNSVTNEFSFLLLIISAIILSKTINMFRSLSVLSSCFLIGTEKVIYFSVFSPKHPSWSLNSFANCLIIKW